MYGSSDYGNIVYMVFTFLLVIFAVTMLLAVAYYILTAIAVYKVAKRRGIDHAFLAWIPIAQTYLFAELIGTNVKIGNVTIPRYPWIYTGIICLGSFITGIIPYLTLFASFASAGQFTDRITDNGASLASSMGAMGGELISGLVGLIILAVKIYTMYRVFKLFKGNAILFTVLGALFPIAASIILLVLSGKPFAEEAEAAPAV